MSSGTIGAFINDPAWLAAAGRDELLNPDDLVMWAGSQLFVNVHPGGKDTATGARLTWSSTLIMSFILSMEAVLCMYAYLQVLFLSWS